MTYKNNNAEKLSAQLIYSLAITAFVVFILFKSTVGVWLLVVLAAAIVLAWNHTVVTLDDNGVHLSKPLRKWHRTIPVSEIYLQEKTYNGTYSLTPFEALIYYRKSMKQRSMGRIRFSSEKELEAFVTKTTEKGYLWVG